jgi:DNA (cytosine-5)-methyltransferase 1
MKGQPNVDTTQTTSCIEWCAGYGGIHLGLKRAIPNLRVIAYGEIEAFACANLVAKMEAGLLDPAPIWTDIKTFPCEEFRDRVDLLVAGYPCQPFSAAGRRLGTEDPRHLWPHIARSIGIIRPRMCFFENVEGHISLGLREVVGELESIGYTTAWGIFSASEVGAPHQRKRVFILGVADSAQQYAQGGINGMLWRADSKHGIPREHRGSCLPFGAWPSRPGEQQHGWEPPRVVVANSLRSRGEEPEHICTNLPSKPSGGDTEGLGNAECRGRASGYVNGAATKDIGAGCVDGNEAMGNSSRQRCEQDSALRGEQQPSRTSEECGTGDAEEPDGQVEPPLGRDPHGPAGGLGYAELRVTCDNRTDELRLLGNGVVPATAERAFRVLIQQLDTPPQTH